MKSSRILIICLILVSLAVATLFISWLVQDKRKMNILVLNKTVPHKNLNEHESFFWILNKNRFAFNNRELYKPDKDYYGFFPLKTKDEKEYYIKSIRLTDIDSLAQTYDAMYCIDAYGVFYADWYRGLSDSDNSTLIYGGLNQNDYYLLKEMKEAGKLIMAEYHTLGQPTNPLIRYKTQDLFDFSWTGWTGRYFKSLDIKDGEVPQWIINKFTAMYNKKWPYKNEGIVFYNNNRIVVLENGIHLNSPFPVVETNLEYQSEYNLPSKIPFTGWFNVIESSEVNQTMAKLNIPTTDAGEKALFKAGIPVNFPFIIQHSMDYLFYYFAGDISENDVPYFTFAFMPNEKLQRIFYSRDENDPKRFFWEYYKPLITGVLEDYYKFNLQSKE
ncbi:MAG: hypothetical protein GVY19_04715 [Bacteroidetes bacterium]|jgi:hypothetical protein|nr:hypothetical protein [Bacteroidota bacterium]